MRKLRVLAMAVVLGIAPLVWASTIAPAADRAHTHDANGEEVALAGRAMSAAVANAHNIGIVHDFQEDLDTHVRLVVRIMGGNTGRLHGGCWAMDNGGVHHSHRITACQLQEIGGSGRVLRGTCDTAGGYGSCSWSTANQHWHSPSTAQGCWQAVGGFDVSGHSHQTVRTPSSVCYSRLGGSVRRG